MNMVILLLVLTLAIRPAYSPIHTGTWHMHVVNGMSHGMRLLVHCRSGDTDLGMKNVTAGTEFEWKFKMNFFDRTVYWCYWYSVFNKFRVHLINGFKNSTLEAHCKSEKGSDFGHQHIPVHQEFSWKFYTYLFADTKYQFYNPRLSYAQLSRLVAVISGSLSSVSLISIFLPYLPGRLIFIVWASFSIVVSRSLIISICRLLYQMIMKTFFQVVCIWNRLKGSDLMEQPRLPV
ncbi:hypothetical protein ACOSP7_003463 [Xanthoceras sorbifolium]